MEGTEPSTDQTGAQHTRVLVWVVLSYIYTYGLLIMLHSALINLKSKLMKKGKMDKRVVIAIQHPSIDEYLSAKRKRTFYFAKINK